MPTIRIYWTICQKEKPIKN